MYRNVRLLILLLVLATLFALPAQGADNRLRVAVLPFDDGAIQGQERWWRDNLQVGKGVADELVSALLTTGKFRLIEREQLQRVLEEQNLASQGRIDSGTAARIGRILGVQILIMGKVTEFSTSSKGGTINIPNNGIGINIKANTARVTIDARMVDTSSAEIKAAATGRGEKKQTNLGLEVNYNRIAIGSDEFKKTNLGVALRDAVSSIAAQLSDRADRIKPSAPTLPSRPQKVSISGSVAEIYGSKIYINVGAANGVRPGMRFTVYRIMRVVRDPNTGKIIDYITEPVAKLSVAKVRNHTSICTISSRLNAKYRIQVKDIVKQM
jgi:curli biogenesis system outer membrane secretion channel CsgG